MFRAPHISAARSQRWSSRRATRSPNINLLTNQIPFWTIYSEAYERHPHVRRPRAVPRHLGGGEPLQDGAALTIGAILAADAFKLLGNGDLIANAELAANLLKLFGNVDLSATISFGADAQKLIGNLQLASGALIGADALKLLGQVNFGIDAIIAADAFKLFGNVILAPFAGLGANLTKFTAENTAFFISTLFGADVQKLLGNIGLNAELQLGADFQKLLSPAFWNIDTQLNADFNKLIGEINLPIYSYLAADLQKLIGQIDWSVGSQIGADLYKSINETSFKAISILEATSAVISAVESSFDNASQLVAQAALWMPLIGAFRPEAGLIADFLKILGTIHFAGNGLLSAKLAAQLPNSSKLIASSELEAGPVQFVTSGIVLPAIGLLAADIDVYRFDTETLLSKAFLSAWSLQVEIASANLGASASLASQEWQMQQAEAIHSITTLLQSRIVQLHPTFAELSIGGNLSPSNYFSLLQPLIHFFGEANFGAATRQYLAAPIAMQALASMQVSPIYLNSIASAIIESITGMAGQAQVWMNGEAGMLPACFMSVGLSLHRILLTKQPPITVQLANNTIIVKGDIVIDIEE